MSTIDSLTKGSAAYQASSIPSLEAHLSSQVGGAVEYNFNVNRTLAKLYKCFPSLAKEENYTNMLQLSLQQFPDINDYEALLCLIPEERKPSCSMIVQSSELLEAAKFEEFWKVYPNKSDEKIRAGIAKLFSNVYCKVDTDVLAKALGMSSDEAITFTKSQPGIVESVDGSTAVFVSNSFNAKDLNANSVSVKEQGISMASVSHLLRARLQ